jgi:2-polyprenyl-6-methoxyphenol hydroxylase-like FAD-dependent oxidoreductase
MPDDAAAADPAPLSTDHRAPLPTPAATRLAVIGAGPVGLTLALFAARLWPEASVTVFDARPASLDVSADPRTLALSLGSIQLLQRLQVWPAAQAQPIVQVHVSQAPPTLTGVPIRPELTIRALDEGVPQLGAVLRYGQVVAPLQQAWAEECEAAPSRCQLRLGTPVAAVKPVAGGAVEVDAGIAEPFDLAVIAEGGVFADQPRKSLARDYHQTSSWRSPAALPTTCPAPRTSASRATAPSRCCRCRARPPMRPTCAVPRWSGACRAKTIRSRRWTTTSAASCFPPCCPRARDGCGRWGR